MSEAPRYNLSPKSLTELLGERDALVQASTGLYGSINQETDMAKWSQAILAIEAIITRLDREILDRRKQ